MKFSGVGISAIAACVPAQISKNAETLRGLVSETEIEKTVSAIGIREKRIAPVNVCASDLCFAAAEKLLSDNAIARDSIDVLLFLSQTPDYKIPATAPIIAERLGLSRECACLDLSLGCSGYVYALSTAFAYASVPSVRRVLVLVGETFSKIVNARDKVNAPLYGDAGTATLVEKSDAFGDSHFVLKTDGAGAGAVIIPAGGARLPDSAETLAERADADGSVRSASQVFMNGMDVFNFAIRAVPSAVKEAADAFGLAPGDFDFVVFHQANKMLTDFLGKRMKIPAEKILYSLGEYGNTSSASVPLTLASCLAEKNCGNVLLSGFGAGFSWGAVALNLAPAKICGVVELA